MSVQDRYPHYLADQREMFDALVTEDWVHLFAPESVTLWRFDVDLLMRMVRPATILDLGCGAGFHDLEMARRPFVRHIDALDYSPRSIERARERFSHEKIRYAVADFADPAAITDTYDLVVAFQVIEHLEDPEAFLRLCRAHCRAGGRVAIFTPNRSRPYNRRRICMGKPPILEDPMHLREFDKRDLAELGRRSGLRPRRVFGYGVAPPWRWARLGHWAGYYFPWLSERLGALYEPDEGGSSPALGKRGAPPAESPGTKDGSAEGADRPAARRERPSRVRLSLYYLKQVVKALFGKA